MSLQFKSGAVLFACGVLLVTSCNLVKTNNDAGRPSSSSRKDGSATSASESSSSSRTTFSPSSDARKDVHEALARLNTAYPYRLTEEMSALTNGKMTMPGGTRVVEFAAADRSHMKWTGGVGGDVEAISIGDKHYWYSDGKWTEGSLNQGANRGLDFEKKLADMVKDVHYLGPDIVNGTASHLYTCTLDGEMAGQSWSGTSKIWIGAADGLIHQSESDFKFGDYGGKSHIVYEYDANIKIEPPVM